MIIIACVDDNGGVLFNHRRQSSDRVVRQRILELCTGSKLWMSYYSAREFEQIGPSEINLDDDFILKAQSGEYCFTEGAELRSYEPWIEQIILFRWNRVYPADVYFDISLKEHGWQCISREEFAGYSHERITMEQYTKLCNP